MKNVMPQASCLTFLPRLLLSNTVDHSAVLRQFQTFYSNDSPCGIYVSQYILSDFVVGVAVSRHEHYLISHVEIYVRSPVPYLSELFRSDWKVDDGIRLRVCILGVLENLIFESRGEYVTIVLPLTNLAVPSM